MTGHSDVRRRRAIEENVDGHARPSRERNKALVQNHFTAWADGTGNPFELLDDNATWTITGRSAASKTYLTRKPSWSRSSGRSTPACRRH